MLRQSRLPHSWYAENSSQSDSDSDLTADKGPKDKENTALWTRVCNLNKMENYRIA